MTSWQVACLFVAIFAMIFAYGMIMYRKGFNDAVDQYQRHLNYVKELQAELESEIYNRHNGGE